MKIIAYVDRPARDVHDIRTADIVRRVDGRAIVSFEVGWLATLAHNLSVAGFGALMFRAGDTFGFHMGGDGSSDSLEQCTCQWSPGGGEPYRPRSRCEHDNDDYDYDDHSDCECTGANPLGLLDDIDPVALPWRPAGTHDSPCIGCGKVFVWGEPVCDYEEGAVHANGCPESELPS